jgi:hypothetical protein
MDKHSSLLWRNVRREEKKSFSKFLQDLLLLKYDRQRNLMDEIIQRQKALIEGNIISSYATTFRATTLSLATFNLPIWISQLLFFWQHGS